MYSKNHIDSLDAAFNSNHTFKSLIRIESRCVIKKKARKLASLH